MEGEIWFCALTMFYERNEKIMNNKMVEY